MRKKIPISTTQQPLQSPFSILSSAGLSKGEAGPELLMPKRRARLVLRREKAQRGGKTVIVISHLPTHLSLEQIEDLSRTTRKALGCGGSVHGREIEIQGDQAERVRRHFQELGYEVAGP